MQALFLFFDHAGVLIFPIIIADIVAFGLLFGKWTTLRRAMTNHVLLQHVTTALKNNDLDLAQKHAAKSSTGLLSYLMHDAIKNFQLGYQIIERKLNNRLVGNINLMDRFMPIIQAIGALFPMLGLLGTVLGMIELFNALAAYGAHDMTMLATGIAEALFTTVSGLLSALPILFFHAYLNTLIDDLIQSQQRFIADVVTLAKSRDTDGK